LPAPSNLVGIYLNSSRTSVVAELVGKNGHRRLGCYYDLIPNGFQLKFVPVANGHLTSEIRFVAPEEEQPVSRAIHVERSLLRQASHAGIGRRAIRLRLDCRSLQWGHPALQLAALNRPHDADMVRADSGERLEGPNG